jgi:hypothetical protein
LRSGAIGERFEPVNREEPANPGDNAAAATSARPASVIGERGLESFIKGRLGLRPSEGEPTPARTIEVLPPSRSDEASWVVIAAAFVVLCVIYIVAFQRNDGRAGSGAAQAPALLPFQVLFRDLPGAEQRVFRDMQEGLGEALRARASKGTWPAAEELARAGVPPFARDVLDKAAFQWSSQREGLVVNYLGVPSAQGASPAFLILVQEPDPATGEKAGPSAAVDEEHQLLPDGSLLHVTYWKRTPAGLRAGVFVDPPAEGWLQIRVKPVFEERAG